MTSRRVASARMGPMNILTYGEPLCEGPGRVGMRSALGRLRAWLRGRPSALGGQAAGAQTVRASAASSGPAPASASPIRPTLGIRTLSKAATTATAANSHSAVR